MGVPSDSQWKQVDPTKDTDSVLQYWVNIHTGNRVYGEQNGFASNHIHLFNPATGADSGLNLDPVSGAVSRDGNFLTYLVAGAAIALEAGVGGAVGVGSAVVQSSKLLFVSNPENINLDGLLFGPATS